MELDELGVVEQLKGEVYNTAAGCGVYFTNNERYKRLVIATFFGDEKLVGSYHSLEFVQSFDFIFLLKIMFGV